MSGILRMRSGPSLCLVLVPGCLLLACAGGEDDATPGERTRTPEGPSWFENVAARAGIDFVHVPSRERRFWFPEIMGSGLGFADVDGDGFLDLFCVQGGQLEGELEDQPGDRLYRNRADGSFEDITEAAGVGHRGYGMGCAFGDCDEDGDLDLFVTNLGPDVLYVNRGNGTFSDVTERSGVGDPRWSTSAAFFDYEVDGDLDLYVANYVNWSSAREIPCTSSYSPRDYCSPNNYNAPAADSLYRNDGGLSFTDVSERAGLTRAPANGLGVACGDYDGDGRMDVYVANDQMPNQLWIAREDGTFTDRALLAGCSVDLNGKARAGMGVVPFDLENDGDLDLLVTNLRSEPNALYLNEAGLFSDQAATSRLAIPSYPFTGFGLGFADFDHDGVQDLYVANGRVTFGHPLYAKEDPFAEPNQLFHGRPGSAFEEVPAGGLSVPPLGISRGLALGDFDNDGDVDVAISNNGSSVELLENVLEDKGHWILLRVLEKSGRDALGARVSLTSGPARSSRTVQAAYSYCSSNDPRVHFGLGEAAGPVEIEVHWLDGTRERFGPLPADRIHALRKGTGERLEETK